MGSECSHTELDISNEDPNTYNDKIGIWNFKTADAKCCSCNNNLRSIKKICVEHGIEQPWEVIDPMICKHDMLRFYDKKKDPNRGVYTGRTECVACKVSAPVFMTFDVRDINGKNVDVQTAEWIIDKVRMKNEMHNKIKNKQNEK